MIRLACSSLGIGFGIVTFFIGWFFTRDVQATRAGRKYQKDYYNGLDYKTDKYYYLGD